MTEQIDHQPKPFNSSGTFTYCVVCKGMLTRLKDGKHAAPNHLGEWRHA